LSRISVVIRIGDKKRLQFLCHQRIQQAFLGPAGPIILRRACHNARDGVHDEAGSSAFQVNNFRRRSQGRLERVKEKSGFSATVAESTYNVAGE